MPPRRHRSHVRIHAGLQRSGSDAGGGWKSFGCPGDTARYKHRQPFDTPFDTLSHAIVTLINRSNPDDRPSTGFVSFPMGRDKIEVRGSTALICSIASFQDHVSALFLRELGAAPEHNDLSNAAAALARAPGWTSTARSLLEEGPSAAVGDAEELYATGLPHGLPGRLAHVALNNRELLVTKVKKVCAT